MSEKIDTLTEGNRAIASAIYTAATASSTDTTSAAGTKTGGASDPTPAGEAAGGYPHTNSHEHADMETDPAQPALSTAATATGPAPRHGETEEGWEKVERKRKEKGKEKKGVERKEGSVPSWADKARSRGVYVTVFIGESRDARPRKGRKPRKDS